MRRARPLLLLLVLLAACSAPAHVRPAEHAFYGLDEPNASVVREQALSRELGVRPTVFSMFVRLDSTTTARTMASLRAAHLVPFVTLEPWHLGDRQGVPDERDALRHLLAGDDDRALLAQARALAGDGGPIYLRFAHEMNAPWYPWGLGVAGNTAAEYVRAWRYVHHLLDGVAGLHARWVWSPVDVGAPNASGNLAPLYPGDGVVDVVGLTAYEHAADDPAVTFDPTLARLRTLTHRPIVLSEIGVDTRSRARWLAALGPYLLRRPDVIGFVYFDTSPATTGATGHYALDDAGARQALAGSLRALLPAASGPRGAAPISGGARGAGPAR